MSPSLTPALALEYLRELSADLRGGVVVGAAGECLAGDLALHAPALALLAAVPGAPEAAGRTPAGAAFLARGGSLAVVLAAGPQVMGALTRHDLRLVLGDLGAPVAAPGAPAGLPDALVEGLLSAAQRGPGE
jgi:hypothetical protein